MSSWRPPDGIVKLADFGLATRRHRRPQRTIIRNA
jgi:hypothetical protein